MPSRFKSKLLESLLQLKLVLYLCSFLEFLMDAKYLIHLPLTMVHVQNIGFIYVLRGWINFP
jgi:hypothetical protein